MSLLLAIESSSNVYRVVLGRDSASIFDSAEDRCDIPFRTLDALLVCGLASISATANEITGITMNIGPGALTFVRAGISFANALAFSLGVSIYPFNWFELMANQTKAVTPLPVVCAVPAANDNAYVGLLRGPSVEVMRFGALPTALAQVSDGLKEIAVAGRIRDRLSSLLVGATVVNTGIENPDARSLLQLGFEAMRDDGNSTSQVEALNDQSPLFYE